MSKSNSDSARDENLLSALVAEKSGKIFVIPEQPTLRDFFAAKAMQAGITRWAGRGSMYDEGGCTHSRLATEAYKIADAMLAERAK